MVNSVTLPMTVAVVAECLFSSFGIHLEKQVKNVRKSMQLPSEFVDEGTIGKPLQSLSVCYFLLSTLPSWFQLFQSKLPPPPIRVKAEMVVRLFLPKILGPH